MVRLTPFEVKFEDVSLVRDIIHCEKFGSSICGPQRSVPHISCMRKAFGRQHAIRTLWKYHARECISFLKVTAHSYGEIFKVLIIFVIFFKISKSCDNLPPLRSTLVNYLSTHITPNKGYSKFQTLQVIENVVIARRFRLLLSPICSSFELWLE